MAGKHRRTRRVRYMIFCRSAAALVAVIMCATGCGPQLDAQDLPALPKVDLSGYLPAVAQQLDAAREQVARKPTSADANGNLGMRYRVYRDYEAAELAFRRARMLAPRNVDWLYYHGEALEHVGRPDEALAAMVQVVAAEPDNLAARLRVAELQTRLGDLTRAEAALAALLDEAPNAADVHVAHAIVLERQGLPEEALAAYARSLELGGHFGRGHYASALLHRRLGNDAEANRHMMLFDLYRSVEIRRDDPRMRELLQLNQSDKPVVRAAQLAKARGDNTRALELLEIAIERNPANQETRAALMAGYAAAGNLARAEQHYVDGAALDPTHVELQFSLGRLRLTAGRTAEAIVLFEEVIQRAPQHRQARAWLGDALQLRGLTEQAGTQLRRAVDDDPRNLTARSHYAKWLLRYGNPTETIEQLRRLASIPVADAPIMHRTLAKALARSGDRDGALAALDDAIALARLQDNNKLVSALRNERGRLIYSKEQTGL